MLLFIQNIVLLVLISFVLVLTVKGRMRHTKTARLISWFLDKLIFHKMQELLGGRVTRIASGGALISYSTQRFLVAVFSAPVVIGYGTQLSVILLLIYPGQSECCGTIAGLSMDDCTFGRIGAPLCCMCMFSALVVLTRCRC